MPSRKMGRFYIFKTYLVYTRGVVKLWLLHFFSFMGKTRKSSNPTINKKKAITHSLGVFIFLNQRVVFFCRVCGGCFRCWLFLKSSSVLNAVVTSIFTDGLQYYIDSQSDALMGFFYFFSVLFFFSLCVCVEKNRCTRGFVYCPQAFFFNIIKNVEGNRSTATGVCQHHQNKNNTLLIWSGVK